ncbi:MAG: hypothetical protein PHN84_06290 [Desulfuromonadaceae bacterium]|nr:hypothetical protein [Desulfuromonadaceae bacterium]MDD2855685.1 hypothetical protein [Desulfuromonadaceae bacterium]
MAIKTAIICVVLPIILTGCIYSNVVLPYSYKFDGTPVGSKSCKITNYKVTEPVSGSNMYAEWTSEFILNEAKRAGIDKVYYMDRRILSILGDTFRQETLIVYGD